MSDIVIMGSGVVGNMAAAWLRRQAPGADVTVIGRTEPKLPIVGESLVEFSTQFFQQIGLGRHLIEEQLPKYGLTFYYKLDPETPACPRYLADPVPTDPPLRSFLVNRFTFDNALRRLNREHGVEYVDGKVTEVDLQDDGPHRVTVQRSDGGRQTCTARWLVDATGRRRLLAKQLGLDRGAAFQRGSFWFRLADFDPAILDRIDAVRKGLPPADGYYSTHHFFGRGNWIWLIPIRGEDGRWLISVGITYRPDLFPEPMTTVPQFLEWVTREHPIVADFVRSGTVLDTNVYRNYTYRARQRYSARRWFLVGDAADTVDPLYSSGLALSAMGVQQVGAAIRRDLEGGLTEAFVNDLDRVYAGFHGLNADQVSRLYDVMHDPWQCHLRMHLQVAAVFHMAMPLFFNAYHADTVGAALIARMGDQRLARQLTSFEALIARAAARRPAGADDDFIQVQSTFALNFAWFERQRDEDIPRSLAQMCRHMAALRLRLMWMAGIRSWFDPVQLGGLLQSLLAAAALAGLGRRSLKRSPVIRRLLSRGRSKAREVRSVTAPGTQPGYTA